MRVLLYGCNELLANWMRRDAPRRRDVVGLARNGSIRRALAVLVVLEELLDERAMPDSETETPLFYFYFFSREGGGDTYTDTLVYLLIIS